MKIPLEDTYADVLSKAQRGLGLADSVLADRAGVPLAELKALREKWVPEVGAKVAPALALHAAALAALATGAYQPAPVHLAGLTPFNTPFDDMTVNSYLVWDPTSRQAVAFDTGSDCLSALDFARDDGLTIKAIFLTHTDGDHIFDLDRFLEKTGAPAYTSSREPLRGAQNIEPGQRFTFGALTIEPRLTFGHSAGGLTYVVTGLAQPVAIVGDALFAGSMGGGRVSYADALRTSREEIMSLPDDAVVCPGHGPLTTIGEQRQANPFFAQS